MIIDRSEVYKIILDFLYTIRKSNIKP